MTTPLSPLVTTEEKLCDKTNALIITQIAAAVSLVAILVLLLFVCGVFDRKEDTFKSRGGYRKKKKPLNELMKRREKYADMKKAEFRIF